MADIRDKSKTGAGPWLVRWRVNGKQKYRQFRVEADAIAFKKTVEPSAHDRLVKSAQKAGDYKDLFGEADRFGRRRDSPEAVEARWSVAEYARRMVDGDPDLRPSTRHVYERCIRQYFEPFDLGRADVRYVAAQEIDRWWEKLDGGQADAYRLVSKVFRQAVRMGDRDDNPLDRSQARKPKRKRDLDFDPLTAEQIETLADAAGAPREKGAPGKLGEMARERDRLLVLVMGYAGLRAGEAAGIRTQDLVKQGDRCQIRVRQQVVQDRPGEPPRLGPPKTGASRRTITVACSLWDELKDFEKKYGTASDGRLFYGPNGEMRHHSLIRGMVRRAATRAGMTGVHPHLLRHSAVSLLIQGGANARAIQSFVGHTDVSMTLGVYGHLFDESGSELAEIMEGHRETHRNG